MNPSAIELINSLSPRIGASPSTCKMGGANYPYDTRPYVRALAENGFPAIAQWANDEWDEDIAAQALALLRRAIAHRSTPMLGAWAASIPMEQGRALVDTLTTDEKALFQWTLKIGKSSDDLSKLFERWE